MTLKRTCVTALAVLLLGPAVVFGLPAPAQADILTTNNPVVLGTAMMRDPGLLAGAAFVALPPSGTPHAVSSTPIAELPGSAGSFGILTTGDASVALDGDEPSFDLNGPIVRGPDAHDVSILRLDLDVPAGANCLAFEFKFLTDEYPDRQGLDPAYDDGFVAELNSSTWTTSGGQTSAPANFAHDVNGNVVTLDSTGAVNVDTAHWAGAYDGGTPLLKASAAVPSGDGNGALPGTASLYLSVFDKRDFRIDSATLVDDIAFATVTNPSTQCPTGAKPPAILEYTGDIEAYWGETKTLSATLTHPFTLNPIASRTLIFTQGSVTAATATNAAGAAQVSVTVPVDGHPVGVHDAGDFLLPRSTHREPFWVYQHPTALKASPVILELLPGDGVLVPTLSATFTDVFASTVGPVAGATIDFYVDHPTEGFVELCSAQTGADGVATCTLTLDGELAALVSLGYEAYFWGDDRYEYAESSARLVSVFGVTLP